MSKRIETTVDLRKSNRNRMFLHLYNSDCAMTKQDLARDLRMSLPTVTQNLNDLMEMGLIAYQGTQSSSGGRKPKVIAVVPDAKFAVGISITRDHVRFVAANLLAQEIATEKITFSFLSESDFSVRIARFLETFLHKNKLDPARLLGVGITVPGIINPNTNKVEFAPTLETSDLGVECFQRNIPYPTYVQNDANAGAFAEWWQQRDKQSFAYLLVKKGVGGSIVIDNAPYLGFSSRSGEFGHLCIQPNGRRCSCGSQGCLEAYTSTDRLSHDLHLSLEEFFTQLAQGNPQCATVFDAYLGYLADGIQMMRCVLDCDVILGGSLTPYMEPYLPKLREMVAKRSPFHDNGDFVHLEQYLHRPVAMGAALHYISQFIARI